MANETYDRFIHICDEVEDCDTEMVLSMFKKSMKALTETSPKTASNIMETFEGLMNYDNYLTEEEAETIVSAMVAQDGTKAGKWKDPETMFRKLESVGVPLSSEHSYNKWAMFCTMNRISSDYGEILNELSQNDPNRYFDLCVRMAVATLEDVDAPTNIRRYFRLQN